MVASRISASIPSFQQHLRQQQVRRNYRRVLRKCRLIKDVNKSNELKRWARYNIETMKHLKDDLAIKALISQGHEEIDQTMIMLKRSMI